MRFLADENVPRVLVQLLRDSGCDVMYIAEIDRAASDFEVAALAYETRRIVITQDQDFGQLAMTGSTSLHGLILLNLDPLSNDAKSRRAFHVIYSQGGSATDSIMTIEPARVRLRKLQSSSTAS